MKFVQFAVFLLIIQQGNGITSPLAQFTTYQHSVELQHGVADLWWTVNDTSQTILFELHMNTTGWIALGISLAGGMAGADIGVGWIDQSGTVYFQDRYALSESRPLIDNTTDWFALQGREQNGWTAIQFQRLLDTCDSMDVAIELGTNHLIFAYGLVDPSSVPPNNDITYHYTRRGLYSLALRSYNDPPLESKFAALNSFEFRLNNYTIPADDTTYYCQVYKAPTIYVTEQHVIAYKIMVNSTDPTLVHHLLMYECDPTAHFNDSNLPNDLCDNLQDKLSKCLSNIAIGWAVGGDFMTEYPPEAGYPIGGNFSVKYYVLQMHYSNHHFCTNCTDSSGIRFYVTDKLRQYDIGYLTFGTDASAVSLTIPPGIQTFEVDSYCPMAATSFLPATGITVLTAFPHTHLQGKSLWTKIIRNKTAVGYLFNAESYDFNYQFQNRLPAQTRIYPGDEFSTRCVYTTINKNTTTFGGEKTTDEMCLHMFAYYPRVDTLHACVSMINLVAWKNFLKVNSTFTVTTLENVVANISWTSDLRQQWQSFYKTASFLTIYGRSGFFNYTVFPTMPKYVDLKEANCTIQQNSYNTTGATQQNMYTTTSITQQSLYNTTVTTQGNLYNTTSTIQQTTTVTTQQNQNNSATVTFVGDVAARQVMLIFIVFLLFLLKIKIDT